MSVVPFTPKSAPRIILDSGIVKTSDDLPPGSTVYWLEFRDGDGALIVWEGATYEAALDAASEWQSDGVRLIDRARA